MCENITTMLYPYDHTIEGKKLRLKQEYLLVSASCQDILRRFQLIDENGPKRQDFRELPDKIIIHLNDSHLALTIPEMMRLLVDVEGVGWDEVGILTILKALCFVAEFGVHILYYHL